MTRIIAGLARTRSISPGLIAGLVALALAACATRQTASGPYALGVPADAPPDMVGVMLAWTPEETIVNFRTFDRIFPTHTVRRGERVRPLPRAAEPIDPIVAQTGGLPVSVEQLMEARRITGVIAVKDGEIILERYAHGRSADDRWASMSVTKVVTSTLIGAAVKDGLVGSIDDPVVRYIPELEDTAYDGVTIRHLMTMSSGVRWNEDYFDLRSDVALAGGEDMVGGVPPLVAYAARLEREAEPGTRYKYQTIDTDIANIALSRALNGVTVADYLSEKIWRPFGMEADAAWPVDKAGVERGGCCLTFTLRDYARFGLFILDGGRAGDVEVLPEGWLREAWAPHHSDPAEPTDYIIGHGFYWQIRADGGYEGLGAYGQSITVYPNERLVIAINSASVIPPGIGAARWDLISAIREAL